MKRISTNAVVTVIAVCILGICASAQDEPAKPAGGPSLEDTFTFIKEKVEGSKASYNAGGVQVSLVYSVRSARGEKLVISQDSTSSFTDSTFGTRETTECDSSVTILLNEIVPESITVANWKGIVEVKMTMSGDKKFDWEHRCTGGGGYPPAKTKGYTIMFQDRQTAEKVARALTHAVKLNGGKAELF